VLIAEGSDFRILVNCGCVRGLLNVSSIYFLVFDGPMANRIFLYRYLNVSMSDLSLCFTSSSTFQGTWYSGIRSLQLISPSISRKTEIHQLFIAYLFPQVEIQQIYKGLQTPCQQYTHSQEGCIQVYAQFPTLSPSLLLGSWLRSNLKVLIKRLAFAVRITRTSLVLSSSALYLFNVLLAFL